MCTIGRLVSLRVAIDVDILGEILKVTRKGTRTGNRKKLMFKILREREREKDTHIDKLQQTGRQSPRLRRCEVVSIERPAPMHHPLTLFLASEPSLAPRQRYNPTEHLII